MKNVHLTFTCLLFFMRCTQPLEDNFNSHKMVSSKGESIYINTLNWGITDDHQITSITKNENKNRERSDTINAVSGLDPFIYRFKNDTLTLYFDREISYHVQESFKTIVIDYLEYNKSNFNNIREKARKGYDGFNTAPISKISVYPPDMPKPNDNQ